MTRKDYWRAANLLTTLHGMPTKKEVIEFLCMFFKEDNPLFNEKRFRAACEEEEACE